MKRLVDGQMNVNIIHLNHRAVYPFVNDTGSTENVIGSAMMAEAGLSAIPISPIEVELAIKSDRRVLVKTQTQADIKLVTGLGTVIVRNVRFMVVEGEMSEVIIGRKLLKELGIDVDEQMSNLSGRTIDLRDDRKAVAEAMPEIAVVAALDDDEVAQQLEKRLDEATVAGATPEQVSKLRTLVYKYREVWRVNLCGDPPANVRPLKVVPKGTFVDQKPRARRMGPMQSEFVNRYVNELTDFGLLERVYDATHANPVHVVRKADNPTWEKLMESFRLTGDYVQTNVQMQPLISSTMPDLEVVTQQVKGSKYFMSCDGFKAFWMLPLHPDSRRYFAIVTDRGVWVPTRVPQGATDSAVYFQSIAEELFHEVNRKSMIIWLDDNLIHAESFDGMLTTFEYVLRQCQRVGFKLSAKKTCLFALEAKFCGKIITGTGVRHDPARTRILSDLPAPTTVGELQQAICAMNWMKNHIPDFSRISLPLRDALERSYKLIGKRTKRAVKDKPLTLTRPEIESWKKLKAAVGNAAELAHIDDDAQLCLFTDASLSGWGAVLMQVRDYDIAKPITEQQGEPLAFLGGIFRGAQLSYPIVELEAFAIIESLKRLDYMLHGAKPFFIFTDHANLVYIFRGQSGLKRQTSEKLERWGLRFLAYKYVIEHISGEDNHWADMISRVLHRPAETMVLKRLTVAGPPLHPFDDLEWPTLEHIRESQSTHRPDGDRPDLEFSPADELWRDTKHQRTWIPEADVGLRSRLLIVSHCGPAGHRGVSSTFQNLKTYCYWKNCQRDVNDFVRQCLLCLQSKGGATTSRPLAEAAHATQPHAMLHLDWTELDASYDGMKYVLVIKDDFSQYVELYPSRNADAQAVATALEQWFSRFGLVNMLVTDQGTHFKNQYIRMLENKWSMKHHFTTAYCPWANGTVEVVNRTLKTVLRVLLREMKRSSAEWTDLLPLVQFVLNQTRLDSLDGLAPVQVHTGAEPTPPLSAILMREKTVVDTPSESATIRNAYSELRVALANMHKRAREAKEKKRKANRKTRECGKRRAPVDANYEIGDFVLWSNVEKRIDVDKLMVRWLGPFRVVATISAKVYTIEHLLTGQTRDVHSTRLRFYSDKSLNVTQELKEHISSQGFDYVVDSFVGLRHNPTTKRYEIRVRWSGFQDIEDSWEGFDAVLNDVPRKVIEFLIAKLAEDAQLVKQLYKRNKQRIRTAARKHQLNTDLFE